MLVGKALALRDRVELVIVAGGAAHGQAQENGADRFRPVLGVDHRIFLRKDAALVRGDVVTLKTGGDQLVERRVGQ